MRTLSHRGRTSSGTALVEFALVAPLLLILLAGALDFGMSLRTATQVAAAARAGAAFGSSSPINSANAAGIQAAGVNAAPGVAGLTVTSLQWCQCSGGVAVSCSGSCNGSKMLVYTQVTATAATNTIFDYSGLGFSGIASSQASMRAQ